MKIKYNIIIFDLLDLVTSYIVNHDNVNDRVKFLASLYMALKSNHNAHVVLQRTTFPFTVCNSSLPHFLIHCMT